jgi:hypothetical protein
MASHAPRDRACVDRARRRDGDSMHGIARRVHGIERRVTEPCGDRARRRRRRGASPRPTSGWWRVAYLRAWCEDRAKRPAGPTGVARRATRLVRACDVADEVASLASGAARRCRRRCPCRVSASQRGRDRRAALCRSRRRGACHVSTPRPGRDRRAALCRSRPRGPWPVSAPRRGRDCRATLCRSRRRGACLASARLHGRGACTSPRSCREHSLEPTRGRRLEIVRALVHGTHRTAARMETRVGALGLRISRTLGR